MMPLKITALVPARSGSKRIPHKNIRLLNGHPLLVYSIAAAQESGLFDSIVVSSDSPEYGRIAEQYGADYFHCPLDMGHGDRDADILWVKYALSNLPRYDAFAILRPTSPFRTAETIRRAWNSFLDSQPSDSLRAVELARNHPGKMWVMRNNRLFPLLPWLHLDGTPWHSSPTQSLPQIYIQNASLEIVWAKTVIEQGTIAGVAVIPFFTTGAEGFDINNEDDWVIAEAMSHTREMPSPKKGKGR